MRRMKGGLALIATVLLLSGQPALAAGGTWTRATSIDECVDAGVEFFIEDLQQGRSKAYCFEVAPDAAAARSTHFMAFPNVRPASARVVAANACYLGVAIPQWEAKRQLVVGAPEGKRRVNDYGIPERYDGEFKTARARVGCERDIGLSVPEPGWTQSPKAVRDWVLEVARVATRRPARELGPLSRLVRAVTSIPTLLWPDAPAPASVADFVPAAREQVRGKRIEGLRLPLHLRFVEARCRPEGSGVALVFEELRPPYLASTYAYAVRGSMPTSKDDAWGGGYGMSSVLTDPEFIHLMGTDTVPCP